MSNSKRLETWKKISIIFDDINEVKKLLEDNYMFSEILDIDTYEERKFEDKDTAILSIGFSTIPIPNIIMLLASITTIIDFILNYFKNNKKGKIIIKKGDTEITIDGDYGERELEKILNSFTEIATVQNIEQFLQTKRYVIMQDITHLNSNIDQYQEMYEIISKSHKDRAEKYIIRINYWSERKKFLLRMLDELESAVFNDKPT